MLTSEKATLESWKKPPSKIFCDLSSEWCNLSFLRRQESRLCGLVILVSRFGRNEFLDCRFRGNDTVGPFSEKKGECFR